MFIIKVLCLIKLSKNVFLIFFYYFYEFLFHFTSFRIQMFYFKSVPLVLIIVRHVRIAAASREAFYLFLRFSVVKYSNWRFLKILQTKQMSYLFINLYDQLFQIPLKLDSLLRKWYSGYSGTHLIYCFLMYFPSTI